MASCKRCGVIESLRCPVATDAITTGGPHTHSSSSTQATVPFPSHLSATGYSCCCPRTNASCPATCRRSTSAPRLTWAPSACPTARVQQHCAQRAGLHRGAYSCSLYEPPTYTLRARSNSLYGCTYGCSYSYAVLLYILHPVYTPAYSYSETMPWGPATAPRRCPDPASCFVPAPPRRGAKHALHTLLRPAAARRARRAAAPRAPRAA